MYHIIYKTESKSGKYYIGRHSTEDLEDGYLGSGKWIRSMGDKTDLVRTILEYCETYEELLEKEKQYINENIENSQCMNFNNSSCGFASGDLNPSHKPEEKLRRSLLIMGDNNPAKRPEVREKKSQIMKGRAFRKGIPHSDQAKENISKGRTGIKYSDEGRKKLSESRKRQYESGNLKPPSWAGQKHSEETKKKQREVALQRERVTCPHCNKTGQKNAMAQWHFDKCKHIIREIDL